MNPFGTTIVQGKKKKKVKQKLGERKKPKRRSAKRRRGVDVNMEEEINKIIYTNEFNNYEDKIYEDVKYIKEQENEMYLRDGIEELHMDEPSGDVYFDDQDDYIFLDEQKEDVCLDEAKNDILSKESFDDVLIKVVDREINREINGKINGEINREINGEIPLKKEKWMWKTILEIEMKVVENCKKEEWEESKGDFLEICLDEFIKKENEYNKIHNKVIIEKSVLENQNMLWNKWIERHRYMLEKWKKEEWFYNLKNEWINEIENYEKKESDIEIILPSEKKTRNISLEKQKIIWRRWVARYVQHIDDDIIEEWFKKMMAEYEKEEYYLNKNRYKIINHIRNRNDKHDENVQCDDEESLVSSSICFDVEEKKKKKFVD